MSKGPDAVYDDSGKLRYEPLISIVPRGEDPNEHWQATWSDIRYLWGYRCDYPEPLCVKKHADYLFNGSTSGEYEIHRMIKVNDEERRIVTFDVLSFKLIDEIGATPERCK